MSELASVQMAQRSESPVNTATYYTETTSSAVVSFPYKSWKKKPFKYANPTEPAQTPSSTEPSFNSMHQNLLV